MQRSECFQQGLIHCSSRRFVSPRRAQVASLSLAMPNWLAQVLDIEDLGRIGESRSVCPYFLARWVGRVGAARVCVCHGSGVRWVARQ